LNEALPTQAEEEAGPDRADERYAVATTALRQRTRTGPEFKLVAQQNAEYGMRRNCLGLRPLALAVATAVLVASIALFFAQDKAAHFALPAGVSIVALIAWFLVDAEWVRAAAQLYAIRLMETIETLASPG
jgi:hypothetical protein